MKPLAVVGVARKGVEIAPQLRACFPRRLDVHAVEHGSVGAVAVADHALLAGDVALDVTVLGLVAFVGVDGDRDDARRTLDLLALVLAMGGVLLKKDDDGLVRAGLTPLSLVDGCAEDVVVAALLSAAALLLSALAFVDFGGEEVLPVGEIWQREVLVEWREREQGVSTIDGGLRRRDAHQAGGSPVFARLLAVRQPCGVADLNDDGAQGEDARLDELLRCYLGGAARGCAEGVSNLVPPHQPLTRPPRRRSPPPPSLLLLLLRVLDVVGIPSYPNNGGLDGGRGDMLHVDRADC